MSTSDYTFEPHYGIGKLAELWGVSYDTVRREVMQEDDVLKVSGPSGKTSYRVPESVARRIHTRLTATRKRPELVKAR
jgi:hypothetical protein